MALGSAAPARVTGRGASGSGQLGLRGPEATSVLLRARRGEVGWLPFALGQRWKLGLASGGGLHWIGLGGRAQAMGHEEGLGLGRRGLAPWPEGRASWACGCGLGWLRGKDERSGSEEARLGREKGEGRGRLGF